MDRIGRVMYIFNKNNSRSSMNVPLLKLNPFFCCAYTAMQEHGRRRIFFFVKATLLNILSELWNHIFMPLFKILIHHQLVILKLRTNDLLVVEKRTKERSCDSLVGERNIEAVITQVRFLIVASIFLCNYFIKMQG